MTCQKCKHQFCWFCQMSWFNHSPLCCFLISSLKVTIPIILIFTLLTTIFFSEVNVTNSLGLFFVLNTPLYTIYKIISGHTLRFAWDLIKFSEICLILFTCVVSIGLAIYLNLWIKLWFIFKWELIILGSSYMCYQIALFASKYKNKIQFTR